MPPRRRLKEVEKEKESLSGAVKFQIHNPGFSGLDELSMLYSLSLLISTVFHQSFLLLMFPHVTPTDDCVAPHS